MIINYYEYFWMIVHVKQTNISGLDSSGTGYHVWYRGNFEAIIFMFNTCLNNDLTHSILWRKKP